MLKFITMLTLFLFGVVAKGQANGIKSSAPLKTTVTNKLKVIHKHRGSNFGSAPKYAVSYNF